MFTLWVTLYKLLGLGSSGNTTGDKMPSNNISLSQSIILILITCIILLWIYCRLIFFLKKKVSNSNTTTIGFFHPNCSAFGGGERVLWKIIHALDESSMIGEENTKNIAVVVYTADAFREEYTSDLLKQVENRFAISISQQFPLSFVHLHDDALRLQMDPGQKTVPRSMIGESIQSMRLAWAALQKRTPHIFFDTTGCAFTFFIAKILAGCKVFAYVHYPTISTDMLSLVWDRRPTYNNNSYITQSPAVSYLKLLYYVLFAVLYGVAGTLTDMVMVNSTWTFQHIRFLWPLAKRHIHILFPPCNTQDLRRKYLDGDIDYKTRRKNYIVSIGQFRPEKDHALQLKSFARLLQKYPEILSSPHGPIKLVLVGGCRCNDDEKRIADLRKMASLLGISELVEFVINQPYSTVQEYLLQSSIGLHTMWNEHFGIGIVEMMAAGLVVIAHDSGGPKSDIIIPGLTGYLATNEEDYSEFMYQLLKNGPNCQSNHRIRDAASASVYRFSDEAFIRSFHSIFNKL